MKKVLIGMLALGSFSAFGSSCKLVKAVELSEGEVKSLVNNYESRDAEECVKFANEELGSKVWVGKGEARVKYVNFDFNNDLMQTTGVTRLKDKNKQ